MNKDARKDGAIITTREPEKGSAQSSLSSLSTLDHQILGASPEVLYKLGLQMADDGFVKWRDDTPLHPRNWPMTRKVFDISLIMFFDFFTTATNGAGASIAEAAMSEYNISRIISLLAFGTMYQFGQAAGGIIFPAYSEAFGRKMVYVMSGLLYSLVCLSIGLVHGLPAAFVGRFVCGFMSAAPGVVASGSIEDMFNVRQRVVLVFVWACAGTAGVLFGPMFSIFIISALRWRWVFYIASMITGALTVLLLFIRESRPSQLLSKQLARLHKYPGCSHYRIFNPDETPDLKTFVNVALKRPVLLFFADPIVCVVSILAAVSDALLYFFTEALNIAYSGFGFSTQQSSLLFLVMGLGVLIGIIPRLYDWKFLKQKSAEGKSIQPEDKLIGFNYAAPALAIGLWWLALTIPPQSKFPWWVSTFALIPIGFAINEFAYTLMGYLADTYTVYASSAFVAMCTLRAVLGGVLPFAARPMYDALDANTATVIIASFATLFCIAPPLFQKYGMVIRMKSKFARYSLEVNNKTQVGGDSF